MKKIIIMLIAVLGIIFIIPDVFAYTSQSNTQFAVIGSYGEFHTIGTTSEYEEHIVKYRTTSLLTYNTDDIEDLTTYSSNNNIDIIINFNSPGEIVGYKITIGVSSLELSPGTIISYLVISYDDAEIYFYNAQQQIIATLAFTSASILIYYTIQVFDYDGHTAAYSQGYDRGYTDGEQDGYNESKKQYGYYNGTNWITASVYGLNRYNAGLDEARGLFGYFNGTNWLTAEQWGDIRYNIGYDTGLSNEIDWWSWSTTFFLMPFRILNIQILPGVRIGYFALFSLLLGVVGWFFFIVGKGGGRRK